MGYIYIRDNEWYRMKNVVMVGVSTNITESDNMFIENEPRRGKFILVIEIKYDNLNLIDRMVKKYFSNLNVGSGIGFYNRSIIELLPIYINGLNIESHILSRC